MEQITQHDREILREIAQRYNTYANSPENEAILRKWHALAEGRREFPTVRLLFSNFTHEVITPRLRCTGDAARAVEAQLLSYLVGRELFGDDTPLSPTFDVRLRTGVAPFGISPKRSRVEGVRTTGYHIDPVIEDLEEEWEKLKGGHFNGDPEGTQKYCDFINEIFGDILPARIVMPALTGAITNPLVHLMGMENYYLAMYDCPEILHKVMDMATTVYENYYDFLEREKLLLPTAELTPLPQESFSFNHELPADSVTKTTDCWGFLESQETTAVSPEVFGEFVFPYQDRLAKRYGLLSYGCCERVDAIWPDYLSKWKNLRKLSVSPFNNEPLVGEYLRGSNVVYYSKPRAEFVTAPGPLDEDALREYFKMVCTSASGCLFEMAQREVLTLHGDPERGRQYVRIAKECVERFWQP
ncbi:MAG: hypothetical protein E7632_00090 [Ruminococcaceae bacterium]|nr:hypothetical protein [Oscillospiraceae bacterium]